MAPAGNMSKKNPYLVQLKIVLMMALSHFETPGLLDDQRMDHAAQAAKQVLVRSQKQAEIRMSLGHSRDVWVGLTNVLTHGIPALERQSFPVDESGAAGYIAPTAGQIAANLASLLRDVECINDLCIIARNMLATKQEAQDLAADTKFDQHILKLIDVCNRVCARGYDGEANARTEERWQRIINAYKKLLVTCLQFLHNLVMNNERRKLLLWMDLFGNSPCADSSFMGRVDPAAYFPPEDFVSREELAESMHALDESDHAELLSQVHERLKLKAEGDSAASSRSRTSTPGEPVRTHFREADFTSPILAPATLHPIPFTGDSQRASSLTSASEHSGAAAASKRFLEPEPRLIASSPLPQVTLNRTVVSPLLNDANFTSLGASRNVPLDDEFMPCTPADAARSLQFAKEQLVDRLFGRSDLTSHAIASSSIDGQEGDDPEDGVAASETAPQGSVEEEDDEAYHGPGDQERGLLTDIPLILGPNEIEALPMIIQTGIVDSFASKNPAGINENMQAIRCNILISQESGRNLLRELLIFVAAWDLADDELYFKMMVQIMEAILINGLVPYTYQAFAETKDIISPAQAVIIKLLTQIFRGKPAPILPALSLSTPDRPTLLRVHVLVIRYIFAHFRQSVIPETCGLIYLQGQIRRGHISADDFPLNFWDMERVYEGVYQYLEFLAVLTETEGWKRLLVKWEVTFELIVLLRELEDAIPNGRLPSAQPPAPARSQASAGGENAAATAATAAAAATTTTAAAAAAAAATPEPSAPPTTATTTTTTTTTTTSAPQPPRQPKAVVSVERPFEPDPPSPPPAPPANLRTSPAPLAVDNPEEFEWRNLKKLVVLVLSSLVWKAPGVQDQVRQHGGVELVLRCCNYDSHNPYIREHAIMCLRFLLEGNDANARIVRELEAKQAVPNEVLDQRGYETFIDANGKVGLRRKETTS